MHSNIEGSSPKKLIKRTHNLNPTYHSYHMLGALQYQNDPELITPRKHTLKETGQSINAINRIVNSGSSINDESKQNNKVEFDSLYRAEKQFLNKKMRNPLHYMGDKQLSGFSQQFGQNLRSKSSNALETQRSFLNKINFKNSSTIKQKQQWGYDIINNLSNQ